MKSLQLIPLVLATSLAVLGCKGKDAKATVAPAGDEVISVVVDTITQKSFDDWVSFPAELRGIDDAQLVSTAGGHVAWVAEVGTHVKAGDSICDIESERYAAVVAQAQASVDMTKNDLDRAENNVKAGSVGKAALDQATVAYDASKVNLLQAKRIYEDNRCQAPFDGVVVSRSIDRFQTLTIPPAVNTVRVARTDHLEAQVSIPEADLNSYQKGARVRFSVPDLTYEEYSGYLKTIDLAVDSRTRTGMARLDIENHHNKLGPGMAGKVMLLRKHYDKALVLATTAVLHDEQGTFAMVAEKGLAQRRSLTLGPANSDSLVVLSGLKVGDNVIVQGGFRVTNGTKVKF